MNRFYVIVPIVLIALFSFFYWQHMKTAAEKEHAREEQIAHEKAEADAKKKVAEQKAAEDARKRDQEREAEEKKKAEDRKAKYDADIKKIRDDIAKYTAQANDFAKQSAKLDQDLANSRAAKDKANREAFDLHKQVERAQVEKRTAEFEIQRLTDMIARRATESQMARSPVVASTEAAASGK